MTGADGKASFSFAADRAGEYTVTASGSVAGENASATHGVDLEVRSFYLAGSIESQPAQQGAAVIAPAGDYAYFGGGSGVEKIDLRSFEQVGLLALEPGDSVLLSAVMDPAGRYAYFGTESGRVVKIDLATFQRVGAINLTQDDLSSAVIDPSGGYAYFGTANTSVVAPPSKVLKVDLATFSHVGTLALEPGEESLWSAVMDPAGHFAYFGAQGDADLPANVVKVDLATFSRVGAATLTGRDEGVLTAAVIDPKGTFAYFGTGTPVNPARVVKVDLVTLERVGALVLDPTEVKIQSAVMDPFGRYAYFTPQHSFGYAGAAGPGAKVVKVDLESFARHSAITMPTGDMGSLRSAVIDPAGNFAYFKKIDVLFPPPPTPAKVYKIAVSRPPVSWLAAGDDAYATPYATPLTIRAPGVLANDTDTGDGDPLTAALLRQPAHGTVSLAPDGSFTHTSDAGFSGVDTFTYRASDAMDLSAPATVTVTVAEPPVGVQSVSGGAHGYFTNVSLFGGPASTRGPAPAVTLPANGGNESATDPDGAEALYGPARIF
ncbi:MAG TPA: cadherin-like domain-containing protein, partial [Acidimicrobiia bacterium]|nr:cadherin-like domain-containing protein [Acidimicrobiia bacterium]